MKKPSKYISDLRLENSDAGWFTAKRAYTEDSLGWRDCPDTEGCAFGIRSPKQFNGQKRRENGTYTDSGKYELVSCDLGETLGLFATRNAARTALRHCLNFWHANPETLAVSDFVPTNEGSPYYHNLRTDWVLLDTYTQAGMNPDEYPLTPGRWAIDSEDLEECGRPSDFDTIDAAVAFINAYRQADAAYYRTADVLKEQQATLNAALAAFEVDSETALLTLPTSHGAHLCAYVLSAVRAELNYQARG